MKKIITLIVLSSVIAGAFGYTMTDVSQANYLASKKIIKDWSSNPKNYRFDDYIARSEIMGMILAMMNITRNTTCRGDFVDVPKSNTDWVCRTIETAADHGLINARPAGMKTRPYDSITRAEALGILMKASKNTFSKKAYCDTYAVPDTDFGCGAIELMQSGENMQNWQFDTFLSYYASILKKTVSNIVSSDTRFRANARATRGEVFDFAYNILHTQVASGTCGQWNGGDFSKISAYGGGLDIMAIQGTNNQFCSSGTLSHLYENNTGIAWSCDGTTNRVCKTDAFSYGTSRLRVDSISGEGKKGALVTLNVSNFPFNSTMQIQAGNYSRHAIIQLVEGFGVSADSKKVTFTLPANLNGAMGEIPGESHLSNEPYAIYLTNTSNGEYVKLYNPFGGAVIQ